MTSAPRPTGDMPCRGLRSYLGSVFDTGLWGSLSAGNRVWPIDGNDMLMIYLYLYGYISQKWNIRFIFMFSCVCNHPKLRITADFNFKPTYRAWMVHFYIEITPEFNNAIALPGWKEVKSVYRRWHHGTVIWNLTATVGAHTRIYVHKSDTLHL